MKTTEFIQFEGNFHGSRQYKVKIWQQFLVNYTVKTYTTII